MSNGKESPIIFRVGRPQINPPGVDDIQTVHVFTILPTLVFAIPLRGSRGAIPEQISLGMAELKLELIKMISEAGYEYE